MKMQFKSLLIVCCLIISMNVAGQSSSGSAAPPKGKWSYSAPNAPDGYDLGTIEFKQVEGKLIATVKNSNGTFDIKEIKKVNQQYTASFYVDGNQVIMSLDPKPDKITGVCSVDGSDMPITLTPLKE